MKYDKKRKLAIELALKDELIKFGTSKVELSAIIFSAVVSVFGIYQVAQAKASGMNLLYIMLGLVVLLVVLDQVKRRGFVNLFNNMIKDKILDRVKSYGVEKLSIFLAVSILIVFDLVGSWSTADHLAKAYRDNKVNNSYELQVDRKAKAEAQGQLAQYRADLSEWQSSKNDAFQICADKWKGWKSKYNANCKAEWLADNPKPRKVDYTNYRGLSMATVHRAEQKADDEFLVKYLFWILLFFFMSLTLIAQRMTVESIIEEFKARMEDLGDEKIIVLKKRINALMNVKAKHEDGRTDVLKRKEEAEDTIERKKEEHEAVIAVEAMQRALEATKATKEG
jgi:hypothetical protein